MKAPERLPEAVIDDLLTSHLEAAVKGKLHRTRSLYECLEWCSQERVMYGCQWWLTPWAHWVSGCLFRRLSQVKQAKSYKPVADATFWTRPNGGGSTEMRDRRFKAHVDSEFHRQIRHLENASIDRAIKVVLAQGIEEFDFTHSAGDSAYYRIQALDCPTRPGKPGGANGKGKPSEVAYNGWCNLSVGN